MIVLTRFNQTQVVINADLIEAVESTPDTVVTLVTARKFLVRESVEEVVRRVVDYRRTVGPTRALPEELRACGDAET